MSKSFRSMRFSLYKNRTVTLDDILEQFNFHSFYLSKPQKTEGEIFYCRDYNPDDPCRDYIKSTIPVNSAGDIRLFEYFKDRSDSGDHGFYLLQDVQYSAYSNSLEGFTGASGIDTSMLQAHADFCGCFSVAQLFQIDKLLTLPMRISLEEITFKNGAHSVRLLEIEDLLSSEDLTVPRYWTDFSHFINAKNIICDHFHKDMEYINASIPELAWAHS